MDRHLTALVGAPARVALHIRVDPDSGFILAASGIPVVRELDLGHRLIMGTDENGRLVEVEVAAPADSWQPDIEAPSVARLRTAPVELYLRQADADGDAPVDLVGDSNATAVFAVIDIDTADPRVAWLAPNMAAAIGTADQLLGIIVGLRGQAPGPPYPFSRSTFEDALRRRMARLETALETHIDSGRTTVAEDARRTLAYARSELGASRRRPIHLSSDVGAQSRRTEADVRQISIALAQGLSIATGGHIVWS